MCESYMYLCVEENKLIKTSLKIQFLKVIIITEGSIIRNKNTLPH